MAFNPSADQQVPAVRDHSSQRQPFFHSTPHNVDGAYGNPWVGTPQHGQSAIGSAPTTSIAAAQNAFSFHQNMHYPGLNMPTSVPYSYTPPGSLQMPNDFFNGQLPPPPPPPPPPPYPPIPFPHQAFPTAPLPSVPPLIRSFPAMIPTDQPFPATMPPLPAVVSQAPASAEQRDLAHDKAALPHDQSSHSREEGEVSDTGVGANKHRSDERTLDAGKQSPKPNMTTGVLLPTSNGLKGRGSFKDHKSKFWGLGDPRWGCFLRRSIVDRYVQTQRQPIALELSVLLIPHPTPRAVWILHPAT